MNILMIHHRLPYPLHSGMDKVRYNLICSLMKEHQVTLLVPVLPDNSLDDVEHVRGICSKLITIPISEKTLRRRNRLSFKIWRWVRLVLFCKPMYTGTEYFVEVARAVKSISAEGSFDVVQVSSNVAERYVKYVWGDGKRVLGPVDDLVGAAFTNGQSAASLKEKIIWRLRRRARRSYEPKVFKACDRVFFFSQEDIDRFCSSTHPFENLSILRTPVEQENEEDTLSVIESSHKEPFSIVFVGGLGSAFNVDAVMYFYEEVFPEIRERVPDVHLYVVGHRPPDKVVKIGNELDITVTGAVADVRPYICKAAVYVAPIRAGTGFKTKIIEALALGKAIVATSQGVQGLWALGDDVIRVASSPEEFSRHVIELLNDDRLRKKQEDKALELYNSTYVFAKVTPFVLASYEEL